MAVPGLQQGGTSPPSQVNQQGVPADEKLATEGRNESTEVDNKVIV